MNRKEAEAKRAYEHYSNNVDSAVARVVHSGLSEKKIRRMLKMARTDKKVIEEVIEEVRRQREALKK